jgi:hypothetical protein
MSASRTNAAISRKAARPAKPLQRRPSTKENYAKRVSWQARKKNAQTSRLAISHPPTQIPIPIISEPKSDIVPNQPNQRLWQNPSSTAPSLFTIKKNGSRSQKQ